MLYNVLGPAGLKDGIADVVSATVAAGQDAAVRAQASAALTKLEHRVELIQFHISGVGSTKMTTQGFLPEHPVTLLIDGRKIVTLPSEAKATSATGSARRSCTYHADAT